MKRILKIIILLLIPQAITFIILEAGIRLFNPQLTYSRAFSLASDCFSVDMVLPFTLRKNSACRIISPEGEFDIRASINSMGLRSGEIKPEKERGMKRVLVLGDSFTFGWGVTDEETYPAVLGGLLKQKLGNTITVINAGYADGFSPDSYYLYLKNRGLELDPDLVIMQFSIINDISDLSETVWTETDDDGLPLKIESCCRVVSGNMFRQKGLDKVYQFAVLRESHLFILAMDFLKQKFNLFKEDKKNLPRRDYLGGCELDPLCINIFSVEEQKMKKVIVAMKKVLDSKSIPMMIMMVPMETQVYPERKMKYPSFRMAPSDNPKFLQYRLNQNFQKENIPVLDLYDVLDAKRDLGNPFYTIDDHFNKLGNQITADSLADFIIKEKLL